MAAVFLDKLYRGVKRRAVSYSQAFDFTGLGVF
jgi:hypothetical protein